jgi:predicted CxxxxCH...CXXCH cytochrome family protein
VKINERLRTTWSKNKYECRIDRQRSIRFGKYMRYIKYYLSVFILLGLISYSCSDLKSDVSAPAKLSVHGSNLFSPVSPDFHGSTVKEKGLASCELCHARDFSGGTAGVSCAAGNCHPAIAVHQPGITDTSSANFHGKFIAAGNWNLTQCSSCHGSNYSGGVASPTCNSCHTESNGPEACNTCHGNYKDPAFIAPPSDVTGSSSTKNRGVGAHSTHLYNVKIGALVQCSECHTVPLKFSSPGHINANGRAEVIPGPISNSGLSNASYDPGTFKCANTYCHGNFSFAKANSQYPFAYTADKIEGANYSPIWNKVDGTQAACGTCHGLPPKGHLDSDLRGCATCHVGIVDEYGNIIDKTKHMDGKIEVFGN